MASGAVEPASNAAESASNDTADSRADASAVIRVESRRVIAVKRLIVWLLFGAFFGLMPLFAVALKEMLSPGGYHIDSILKNGELFIVCAVLSAGAIGELLAAASRGLSFFVAVVAGFFAL
jgi:hypothetical protein